jgi:aspartate kinase
MDCEIYTDVEGVYTADPRMILAAKKLNEISYDEMLELARLGAGVLHSRSVEFAKNFKIRLHVRSSFSLENGTIVMPVEEMVEKYVISGITVKQDEAKVTIRDIPDKPGISAKLFNELGIHNIYVNMIVQSTGQDHKASISFTVKKEDFAKTKELCTELNKDFGGSSVEAKEDIAIVSAVGVGMLSHYGVAGKMFGILSGQNINIEMISTSEIGISCVIDSMYAGLAAKSLHKAFVEENMDENEL